MDVTIIVPRELVHMIVAAAPTAVVSEADDDGALGLGQSAKLVIAVQEVWRWANEISAKLAPVISAKPEMELVMEGPGGKVTIKLKNVSERLLRESADKVISTSRSMNRLRKGRREKS
jgi:hypothetical protein